MAYVIDLENEEALTLREVPAAVERLTRRRPHLATVKRWRRIGMAGVRLPVVLVGGTAYTTRQALAWWIRAATAAREAATAQTRVAGPLTDADRQTLERAGIVA